MMNEDLAEMFELQPTPDIQTALSERINDMIDRDFNGLLQLLYRLDIDERKLRKEIEVSPNAGESIAGMIIQRQKEKQEAREKYRQNKTDIPEQDRW